MASARSALRFTETAFRHFEVSMAMFLSSTGYGFGATMALS
jgi:hypothetical protein